jgi:hypothetical protein
VRAAMLKPHRLRYSIKKFRADRDSFAVISGIFPGHGWLRSRVARAPAPRSPGPLASNSC